jgi:capsular polysaccharide biosynthesis protein
MYRHFILSNIFRFGITTHQNNISRNANIVEPVVVIESRPNYAHFILDYFPLFMILNQVPELMNCKIFTYRLSEPQLEMLCTVNFNLDRIIQCDMEPGQSVSFHFEESYVFNRLNPPFSAELLPSCIPKTNPCESLEFIFLSREKFQFKRIFNQDEVSSCLEKEGFVTLHTHEMLVLEIMRKIRHAKVIVSTIGAQLVNAMFATDAIVIVIYPDLPRVNEVMDLIHDMALTHALPCFKRMKMLLCPVQNDPQGRAMLDFPSVVDIGQLRQLVFEAKNSL